MVVRGLPPGALDESSLAGVMNAAFARLPEFSEASGPACSNVQLYAGATYAFVTLRERALAATAVLLPPLAIGGSTVTLARAHGYGSGDEASSCALTLT